MREKRERRARKEGGERRAQIPFPLPFKRHAAYQLTFVYGRYIIAVQLSVTDKPGKSEILEKYFQGCYRLGSDHITLKLLAVLELSLIHI